MGLEVEARFRADGPDVLEALARRPRLGPAELGPPAPFSETDRYLDTGDGRLAAAGWACRLRLRDGEPRLSLKGPGEPTSADWHHRRPELEGPASAALDPVGWPASEARDHLVAITGGHALRERFALSQRRTERAVTIAGTRIGTLSLDAVRILAGGRDRGAVEIVELELSDADPAIERHLAALAGALASEDGLRPEPRTKLELALERIGAG